MIVEVSGLSLDTIYINEDLGITVQYPASWEVINASKMGGDGNEIVVMEDYDKGMEDFSNLTFSAINFSISVLDETAPANDVINQVHCDLEAGQPATRTEIINGQDFFWVECQGFVHVDGAPLFRLFTGIFRRSKLFLLKLRRQTHLNFEVIFFMVFKTKTHAKN